MQFNCILNIFLNLRTSHIFTSPSSGGHKSAAPSVTGGMPHTCPDHQGNQK